MSSLRRAAWVLAMRVMQSNLVLDDEEVAARDLLLQYGKPAMMGDRTSLPFTLQIGVPLDLDILTLKGLDPELVRLTAYWAKLLDGMYTAACMSSATKESAAPLQAYLTAMSWVYMEVAAAIGLPVEEDDEMLAGTYAFLDEARKRRERHAQAAKEKSE